MHNARKTPRTAKNIRENDTSYSKGSKSHCSCPNNSQFKSSQSRSDKTHSNNNSYGKTAEESEKFLQYELKKYGLSPKTKKALQIKHFNSPRHDGRVDISLKSVPKDRIIKVNIKEILGKNKFKSKTVPNLPSDRYVEDLKQEIKSMKRDIPALPDKYKRKYLRALKEELFLNKLTTHHENDQQIESIKNEIETFRTHNSPFVLDDNIQASKMVSRPKELQINIHRKDKKSKNHPVTDEAKGTETNSEAGDANDGRHLKSHPNAEKNKASDGKKKHTNRTNDNVRYSPSPVRIEEKVNTTPVKNYTTISTQCEIEMPELPSDSKMAEKLDAIYDLIPQISSVIEKSEKKLEKAFKNAWKTPKIIQDRGVSPIKDIAGLEDKTTVEDKKEVSTFPKTPPNSSRASNSEDEGEHGPFKPNTHRSNVGDLIINIQNIKENRNTLSGFQKELSHLKKNIEDCEKCRGTKIEGKNENYCEKHAIYIPLLKVGDQCSKGDQIKLFNALKTEASLKKELEKLNHHISRLERRLSKKKKSNDQNNIKDIEKELKLAKSYYNNLLVKQQNERVLSEQQKIMKDNTEHECANIEDCDKCCLHRQIHDLLDKVRENISKDLEDSKRPLKIQKMPNIDIRKPLQLQNILKLDIPPSSPPQISTRSNFVFEAVVKNDDEDYSRKEPIKAKIVYNRTTNVGVSALKNQDVNRPHKKAANVQYEGVATSDSLSEEKRITEPTLAEASPKRPPKISKTPSQLGFRRHIGSQCDSSTCLVEPWVEPKDVVPAAKMSVQTQTSVKYDDSAYLFGFKEYLMKEAGSSPVKQVDVMLQASLEGSSNSVIKFKSIGVDTEEDDMLSKRKSCDFQGVTLIAPAEENESDVESELTLLLKEDDLGEIKGTSSRVLQKTPSLKKMLLPPSIFPQTQHAALESSIQNPYAEPKYRLRRFSVTRQESDIEDLKTPGNDFYRSLTNKELLPERKPVNWNESRSNLPSAVPSVTLQVLKSSKSDQIQDGDRMPNEEQRNTTREADSRKDMENTSSDNKVQFKVTPNQKLSLFDDIIISTINESIIDSVPDKSDSVKFDAIGKESSDRNNDDHTTTANRISGSPKRISVDDNFKREQNENESYSNYPRLPQTESIEVKDNGQTGVLSATYTNATRFSDPKKTSVDEESKPEQIEDENNSKNSAKNKLSNAEIDEQIEGKTDTNSNYAENIRKVAIVGDEPGPERIFDGKLGSNQLTKAESDEQTRSSPRSSVTKKSIVDDDLEPERISNGKLGSTQSGLTEAEANEQTERFPKSSVTKKLSVDNESKPERISDSKLGSNLTKSESIEQTGSSPRYSITKNRTIDDESKPKGVTDENISKKLGSPENGTDRFEDIGSTSKFSEKSVEEKTVISDDISISPRDQTDHAQNIQKLVDIQENKSPSIPKTNLSDASDPKSPPRNQSENNYQHIKKSFNIPDDMTPLIPKTNFEVISEPKTRFSEENKDVLILKKDTEPRVSKPSTSGQKLYKYIPEEYHFDDHLANIINRPIPPKEQSASEEIIPRYDPYEAGTPRYDLKETNTDDSLEYVMKEPKLPIGNSSSANNTIFDHVKDLKRSDSGSGSIEAQTKLLTKTRGEETDATSAQTEASNDEEEFATDQFSKNANPKELEQLETAKTPNLKIDDVDEEEPELTRGGASGFLDNFATSRTKLATKKNSKLDQTEDKTVLPIFPPTYKLIVNKNHDFQNKSSDKNVLLRYPIDLGRKKSLKLIDTSSKKNKSNLYDTDEFIITSVPHGRREVTNITNYILPSSKDKILVNKPCTSKHLEVHKIAQERLAYSKKCTNIDTSQESSLVSSEGEVKCSCKNISAGEIHSCPRGRVDSRKNQIGINYKEKISSHLLLEKERKHYNHWVTYYSTKKYKNESSSSSSQSDSVHDI